MITKEQLVVGTTYLNTTNNKNEKVIRYDEMILRVTTTRSEADEVINTTRSVVKTLEILSEIA